jgi:hypothetical protein
VLKHNRAALTPFDEGRLAFLEGKDAINNPYPGYSMVQCHMTWDKGYRAEANDFGTHLAYVNRQMKG